VATATLPAGDDLQGRIHAVRQFNRFYTRHIGVLQEHLLNSQFSLAEVRVLYELAHREQCTASQLCDELGLDPGYLSRILARFENRGLIHRCASSADRRVVWLALTDLGRETFAPLDSRSQRDIGAMLGKLADSDQVKLVQAMQTIEKLLGGGAAEREVSYILRSHQPGDIGWVVYRHGVLYSQEYGYDEHFEALVAEIAAKFIQNHDPKRERCWIAERHGEIVGSVFLVAQSKSAAKLRLLLVEPSVRGLGIGKRLVDECIRFARRAGYKKISLWTQSELLAARKIYQQAGFRLTAQQPHHSWTRDLVSETWELKL
jgi:DNA-binding MarR family transcriptional regulator/N-acetylglutamate synthase-like GNAT family acetyltransferase